MPSKATAEKPADPFAGLVFGKGVSDDILKQATEEFGKVSDEERLSSAGMNLTVLSVVNGQSKDRKDPDKPRETREGLFRVRRNGETEGYVESIHPLILLVAKTEPAAFDAEGKTVCRGISTDKLWNTVAIGGGLKPAGFDCQQCELYAFREGAIHPVTGLPVTQQEKCSNHLALYCWDPRKDPDSDEDNGLTKLSWSSSSIKVFNAWTKSLENKGLIAWSVWLGIRPKVKEGEEGKSDAYVPEIAIGGTVTKEQFEKAAVLREKLLLHLRPRQAVQALEAPRQVVEQLPAGDIEASDDVFASE